MRSGTTSAHCPSVSAWDFWHVCLLTPRPYVVIAHTHIESCDSSINATKNCCPTLARPAVLRSWNSRKILRYNLACSTEPLLVSTLRLDFVGLENGHPA